MRGTDTTTDPKAIHFADVLESGLRGAGLGHVTVVAAQPFSEDDCISLGGVTDAEHATVDKLFEVSEALVNAEDEPPSPMQAMAWLVLPLVDDLPVERYREIEDAWTDVVAYIHSLEAEVRDLITEIRQ